MIKANSIDFANIREIYNSFKVLENTNFGGQPNKVKVTQVNKVCVTIRFEYSSNVDRVEETKKLNSYFLDRGFKSFTLIPKEETGKFVLSTVFRTVKPKV